MVYLPVMNDSDTLVPHIAIIELVLGELPHHVISKGKVDLMDQLWHCQVGKNRINEIVSCGVIN